MGSTENNIRFGRLFAAAATLALLAAASAGCGGAAIPGLNPLATPTPTPTSTSSTSTSTGDTSGSSGFLPDWSANFSINGSGGVSPTYLSDSIDTDNVFIVEIQAGAGGQIRTTNGTYSNYYTYYDCVSYTVQLVNGNTNQPIGAARTTGNLLAPGAASSDYLCSQSPSAAVTDFSQYATTGHPPFKVKIVSATYDFQYANCMYWYGWGCPTPGMTSEYYTHTITGTVQVQTSLSAPLQ